MESYTTAREMAKWLLREAATLENRGRAINQAISLGMPLYEIEVYLDYLDANRTAGGWQPGQAGEEVPQPSAALGSEAGGSVLPPFDIPRLAHEMAKWLLREAATFENRSRAINQAISLGMPLHEIEVYLDYLDANRTAAGWQPGQAAEEIPQPSAALGSEGGGSVLPQLDSPRRVHGRCVGQDWHAGQDAHPAARRRRLVGIALAASLLVALTLGAIAVFRPWAGPSSGHRLVVAQLGETVRAHWSDEGAPDDNGQIPAGRRLVLRAGFVELVFAQAARVVLQGPAVFEPQSASGGMLSKGQLTAHVEAQSTGFTIRTPNASIVDLGTAFGVAVEDNGRSEIEVFTGKVDVRAGDGPADAQKTYPLQAGEALRIASDAAGAPPQVERIRAGDRYFVRSLRDIPPLVGSVACLRDLIAAEPHLIHYYPFEGNTPEQRARDRRGNLHLSEVVMRGGCGNGALDYSAAGPDPGAKAIRPFRGARRGNSQGVALQSQATFHPPAAMTVELLLSFAGPAGNGEGLIAAAVATRDNRPKCGFLVTAADDGRLVSLLDAEAPWLESGVRFVPGRWYYVASAFQTLGDGQTVVNSYVADLSSGQKTLHRAIDSRVVPGTPAVGRLGIGMGFDGEQAPAYPWSGALQQVAIYNAVLDPSTLQRHLDCILGSSG